MSKKLVLVTGSSQGIGLEVALCLKTEGYDVILHSSLSSEEKIKSLAEEHGLYYKAFDLSNDPTDFIKDLISEFGPLYGLVNNAGVMADASIFEDSYESIQKLFCINTFAPMMISREFLASVDESVGGRIVNISSNAVKYGMGRNKTVQYTASKMALEALTDGLSRIGTEKKVLVNTVRPGIVRTRMQNERKDLDKRIDLIPLKKMAEVEDIANLVVFLMSDKGGHITGQTLSVAGGE